MFTTIILNFFRVYKEIYHFSRVYTGVTEMLSERKRTLTNASGRKRNKRRTRKRIRKRIRTGIRSRAR